ncbi:MAG: hypothetical protein ACKVU1_13975 [bacterium]
MKFIHGNALLLASAVSLSAAVLVAWMSLLAGARVRYLDHLMAFNLLAATMLLLGIAALACSLAGLWRARFRSAPFAAFGFVSLLFLIRLTLDS